jgi:heme/copper-type cytochrome/quinol oxidase subunit 2
VLAGTTSDRIELAWTVISIVVVVLTVVTACTIYDVQAAPQPPTALEATVVGHQWWWEIPATPGSASSPPTSCTWAGERRGGPEADVASDQKPRNRRADGAHQPDPGLSGRMRQILTHLGLPATAPPRSPEPCSGGA